MHRPAPFYSLYQRCLTVVIFLTVLVQPVYKLPMCKMYNEDSCCAPIHDAETQWAYETLVDVADR